MNPQTAVIPGCCEHVVAGERVVMLPERALWLPQHRTLLVADLHWGKAAAIRAAHVPVPTGTTAADLARLTQAIGRTGATRLVVLGEERTPAQWTKLGLSLDGRPVALTQSTAQVVVAVFGGALIAAAVGWMAGWGARHWG